MVLIQYLSFLKIQVALNHNKIKKLPAIFWFVAQLFIVITGCNKLLDPSEPGNLVPMTVDEGNDEHADHAVALNGSIFHIETYGDTSNPVIIFLHGGPGGDFRSSLRLKERYNDYSLTDEYYLVYWDQRGCGLSQRHNDDVLTLDVYTEDGRQIIEQYSSGRDVILIGYSWGGIFSTQLINRYPEKIKGAILLEPGPLNYTLYESIEDGLSDVGLFDEWLNDLFWNVQFLSADDHTRLDYQMMLVYKESQPATFHLELENDPAPFWRGGAAVNISLQEKVLENGEVMNSIATNLNQFTAKVLFIASGNNELVGKDFQEHQRNLYPNTELKVIPDCGHDLQWTKAAEVVGFIHQYLDEIN